MKANIVDWSNKKIGDIELSDAIFALPIRKDILQRVVEWQRANRRAGTHETKGRSEVHGTTKKPFKQKGTGRARQGSWKAPHMRGGGVPFGPTTRDHGYDLPKKFRILGLKTALSAKAADGKLIILKDAALKAPKTKELAGLLKNLGLGSALIIDKELEGNLKLSARNLMKVCALPSKGANVYDILKHDTLLLTEQAAIELQERLA